MFTRLSTQCDISNLFGLDVHEAMLQAKIIEPNSTITLLAIIIVPVVVILSFVFINRKTLKCTSMPKMAIGAKL